MSVHVKQGGEKGRYRQLVLTLSRVWAWAFLAILIIFFTTSVNISTDGSVNFLTVRTSQNILIAIAPVLLMGLGQTFVIISAGIDLSVGWVMGLSSVVTALTARDLAGGGMEPYMAIFIGMVVGVIVAAIFGMINGVIIAKLKVPPFIVTLGMSFIARGTALLVGGGMTIGGLPPEFRNVGNEALFYLVSGGEKAGLYFLSAPELSRESLRSLDRIFSWPVVITTIVVVIAMFLLHRTRFGRHTLAIGGNAEASLRAGIPVDRHTILLYTMSAATAGIAGALHTARFSGGDARAGDPLLLGSIAAVIIGGVSLFGGSGTIIGTVIGALIIAVLQTGLVMLNVDPFWQFVVVGVVVILAVLIDQSRDLIIGRGE
ncbi:MAG: ABC transporter permease [Anaerolineae bacterium]|nr:ABC transporter permease [Anaerolineae bacterium]MCA9907915.1 ABC transporter permease [Anaerolineae bacterium]